VDLELVFVGILFSHWSFALHLKIILPDEGQATEKHDEKDQKVSD